MPLEFSVAAFRFGHSMVRGAYDWNRNFGRPVTTSHRKRAWTCLFAFTGQGRPHPAGYAGDAVPADVARQLAGGVGPAGPTWISLFPDRFARPIDTHLADPAARDMVNQVPDTTTRARAGCQGASQAPRPPEPASRVVPSSLPTGQAVAGGSASRCCPQRGADRRRRRGRRRRWSAGGFVDRTPLWFYVLRESEVTRARASLGPVGSRIVAETIIGQIRNDPRSYLNQTTWTPERRSPSSRTAPRSRRSRSSSSSPGSRHDHPARATGPRCVPLPAPGARKGRRRNASKRRRARSSPTTPTRSRPGRNGSSATPSGHGRCGRPPGTRAYSNGSSPRTTCNRVSSSAAGRRSPSPSAGYRSGTAGRGPASSSAGGSC